MVTAHAFCRDLLPSPLDFYKRELGKVGRPNRAGWCACRCPFHNSKGGKSFAVHVDGAFVCRSSSCGVKGGDVVSFIRQRDGIDFRTACKLLGCWQEISREERLKLDNEAATRKQEREQVAQLKDVERTQRLKLREEVYSLVHIQAEVSDRLSQLLRGAAPAYENEIEDCWHVLSLALTDLRETESVYMSMIGMEYAG